MFVNFYFFFKIFLLPTLHRVHTVRTSYSVQKRRKDNSSYMIGGIRWVSYGSTSLEGSSWTGVFGPNGVVLWYFARTLECLVLGPPTWSRFPSGSFNYYYCAPYGVPTSYRGTGLVIDRKFLSNIRSRALVPPGAPPKKKKGHKIRHSCAPYCSENWFWSQNILQSQTDRICTVQLQLQFLFSLPLSRFHGRQAKP